MGSENPKGEDSLEHIGVDERVTQCVENVSTAYFWFKQRSVAGFCKLNSKPLVAIKCGHYLKRTLLACLLHGAESLLRS